MAGRIDGRDGEAQQDDVPVAAHDPAAVRPGGGAAPRVEAGTQDVEASDVEASDLETAEAEKAKTEIEAGDVADKLADFA